MGEPLLSGEDVISFTLPLEPVAKGRPRFGRHGAVYTPDETVRFEMAFKMFARPHRPIAPLSGPVKLTAIFCLVRPKSSKRIHPAVKSDIDNYLKAIMDSGNGVFWLDDAQICHIDAKKTYCKTARIELRIEEME